MKPWGQFRQSSTVCNNSLTSTSDWYRKSRRLQFNWTYRNEVLDCYVFESLQEVRDGQVWDNSAMESFLSTMKVERVNRKGLYKTRRQAKADIFDYT